VAPQGPPSSSLQGVAQQKPPKQVSPFWQAGLPPPHASPAPAGGTQMPPSLAAQSKPGAQALGAAQLVEHAPAVSQPKLPGQSTGPPSTQLPFPPQVAAGMYLLPPAGQASSAPQVVPASG
jgi:hypothetical protein